MSDIPQWQIIELRARYELEPALQDVYVEGHFDREVLCRCLTHAEQERRVVYPIEAVAIPADLLAKHDLTDGNKQRVIVLARELAALPPETAFRCLVDRDLDHWFGALEETPRLVWTTHCSVELYFLTGDILRDLLITTGKSRIRDWNRFFESFVRVLRDLYAARLTSRELNLSLDWISFDRCLAKKDDAIEFDADEYVKRVLLKNGKAAVLDTFLSTATTWRQSLEGDPRNYIRGHDFLELAAWTIRQYRGLREFASPLALERLLVLLAPRIEGLVELCC